jgi:hypothetical protein
MKNPKLTRKAYLYVPIGKTVTIAGHSYKCVLRGEVIAPYLACRGCDFRGGVCPPRIQCSKFDRRDKHFVWFIRVDTEQKQTKK